MYYYIAKTGLDIFDLCRAYGLAILLDYAGREGVTPVVSDAGSFYLIDHDTTGILSDRLFNNPAWYSLFEESPDDRTWSRVFLTDKQNWTRKVENVKNILATRFEEIIDHFRNPAFLPQISSTSGETLPGPLDPSAFKGLRGKTKGEYSEAQTKVDAENWALACLGGSIAGRYKVQKAMGNKRDYFAVFPVPERIELSNFREIRDWTKTTWRLKNYLGVQNAAAHFSVLLAEKMRYMAVSKLMFADRFSGLFYFFMFQTGQQFKPSTGGNISLYPLMNLAFSGRPQVEKVFKVWSYLFRKGNVPGREDLAEAITAFIMNPTLETYEQHAKVFLRYISKPREIKSENLYDDEVLKEVMACV